MIAFVAPANTGDLVVTENFAELLHLRGAGAPHVHGLVESDCKDVRGAPVDQVQVEVILELWCIQHFVRHLVDPARFAEVSLATRVTREACSKPNAEVVISLGHEVIGSELQGIVASVFERAQDLGVWSEWLNGTRSTGQPKRLCS